MKIVLCTSDFFAPIQRVIEMQGHEVCSVFTSCGEDSGYCTVTKALARRHDCAFVVGQVSNNQILAFDNSGIDLLLCAGYDYKVPTPECVGLRMVNIHGSLLPDGRGPWPQPWILLDYPEKAGVTIHSLTQDWDKGDVILQAPINIEPFDCLESLIGKTLLKSAELVDSLLSDFEHLWQARKPMLTRGSYWNLPTQREKTIDLTASVENASKVCRAFGKYALIRNPVDQQLYALKNFHAWTGKTNNEAGTVVAISGERHIFALRDGFAIVTLADQVAEV